MTIFPFFKLSTFIFQINIFTVNFLASVFVWPAGEETSHYNKNKYNLNVLIINKLNILVQNTCVPEGVDCLMMHEIVLGGHLYLQLLKEKLETWLQTWKGCILKKAKALGGKLDLTPTAMQGCLQGTLTLERMFENFLGTGNLPSITGLGLMQNKGLTIMAENIAIKEKI